MRSIQFSQFGNPANVLHLQDTPRPQPGPNEVLVRMKVRTVNPSDLYTVAGFYGSVPQLPASPGWEGLGVIEELGQDVTGWQVGQRITPHNVLGTWQEYLLVPVEQLVAIPQNVSDNAGAQMGNPLSAWIIAENEFGLKAGEWLLQTGASSQFGRVMIQVARLKGIRTINVVRRPEQVAELQALGADEVIVENEDITARVTQITDGAGVRAIIEAVGGETGSKVINTLSKNGVALLFAGLSGQPISLNPGSIIFKTATLRGFWISDWFKNVSSQEKETVVAQVAEALSKGLIAPSVEATFDLAEFPKALALTSQGGRQGKVLLVG